MNPCKESEPRVIDISLIERCIDEQLPKGEAGRLAREEGVPLDEVKQIRLEYLYILKIDHLWVLSSLTKLSLNNNFIEKIENLDALVNLEELDLSFNKISKIENLNSLVKLVKLSFYENFIKVVENMDTLTNLMILSIGRNLIDDWDNILYLRRFQKLTSVNLAGNPCAQKDNFRLYITVFLPQIFYYEYKKIQDSEKEEGTAMFSDKLTALEASEAKQRAVIEKREKEEQDAQLHSLSFVEYLNTRHLFDEMYQDDEEGKILLELGEEVEEFYVEYEEQFIASCLQVFHTGQKHYAIRQEEIDEFTKLIENAKKDNQEKGIEQMKLFIEKKNTITNEMKSLSQKLDYNDEEHYDSSYSVQEFMISMDSLQSSFDELVHDTWKTLMKLEVDLLEQLDEVIQTFDHTMGELINGFIEETQAIFSVIRSLEVTYTENLSDCANKYLTSINLNEDLVVPPNLKQIMSDKESLINALTYTHDHHMQAIDNREDTLINRAKGWYQALVDDLVNDETARNRNKILEITHFLDIQKDEFNTLMDEYFPNSDSESDI